MAGCVEKSEAIPCSVNGFVMNSELVAGFPRIGCALHPCSSFARAFASALPFFIVFAPVRSARYSLLLDIASCNTSAIIGASMIRNSIPMRFPSLSSLLPKIAANCAICAK